MNPCVQCRVAGDVLRHYRRLYESLRGGFLLPENYPGHAHAWAHLDTGYCVCSVCGAEHVCFRGQCPVGMSDSSEQVCTLTGCVVSGSEMRAEWGAMDRVGVRADARAPTEGRAGAGSSSMELHEFVELVVGELLDSGRTRACEAEEQVRDDARRLGAAGRLLREAMAEGVRPNLVEVEARLAWACRKTRRRRRGAARDADVRATADACVESICSLLQMHGWLRVRRQLTHATRGREFVCSMLYLMRMGITFQGRCLLRRIDALHDFLPQQVFLPSVFGIRPKSITEGENIIKLDIRRMPM